nr:3348_t:CDS:2 [Entrophospora candida]
MESATTSYNMRSPAVKRLLKEARELQQDTCSDYTAQPLEDNLFEWHFVIRGPDSTEFEGGRYHGRILLPSEYPFKPPNLMLMTQNGRFELNKKICLSITGYHPEYWLPAWGIRTVLLALIGFLTTKSNGAIGGIDYTESERKILAKRNLIETAVNNNEYKKFDNIHNIK